MGLGRSLHKGHSDAGNHWGCVCSVHTCVLLFSLPYSYPTSGGMTRIWIRGGVRPIQARSSVAVAVDCYSDRAELLAGWPSCLCWSTLTTFSFPTLRSP